MTRQHNMFAIVCFGVGLLLSASDNFASAATILHQYDFEPTSSYVTEAGWTHIDSTTVATPTSAGFVAADTTVYVGNIDRSSSTQPPVKVVRDLILFYDLGTPANSMMRFQDIIPAFASSVLITYYRSDPADENQANFTTTAEINGGGQTTINTGEGYNFVAGHSYYHDPFTATLAIALSASPGTLDIRSFGSSGTRSNGISFEYTIQEAPEPSSIFLAGMAAAMFFSHRRRSVSTK